MEGQYPDGLGGLFLKYMQTPPAVKLGAYHADTIAYSTGAFGSNDVSGWGYDNVRGDAALGQVWINCTHTDTKGSIWSAY